jgi:hypothetical protein
VTTEEQARALSDAPAAPPCPEAAKIWAASRGEIDAREVLAHALTCGDCALAWQLARELTAESGEARKVVPLSRGPARWMVGVLAGAVAAAAAVVLWPRPPPAEFRAAEQVEIRSETADDLPRDKFVLRWQPGSAKPGARWSLTVATLDLRTLHRASGLSATEYQVPPAALEVAPGTQLVWRVTSVLPGGAAIESPAFLVRVR